jgi:pimeloyl-ACP methyl ester carboxylesterase
MKKRSALILGCILLILAALLAGFILESNTQAWEKFSNRASPAQITQRNDSSEANWSPDFKLVTIPSPVDAERQKAYYYRSTAATAQPLIVSLHSWSWDYRQFDTLSLLSKEKNINYIHPDFRGQNWTKNACCSELVISDIDAAIDFAIGQGNVDTSAIYVVGRSGGGYATLALFMRSKHHIKRFSAWVPLTDLLSWYEETRIRKLNYADNILVCTQSANRQLNKEVAAQKSPFRWKTPVDKLTGTSVDIFTGVYDGLEGNGPIPITQSINFYNKLLTDLKATDSTRYISDKEKLQLLESRQPLGRFGTIGGRDICLRKEYGNIRITIFIGGHEMLQEYAFNELIK